jgi:hypothetical protein
VIRRVTPGSYRPASHLSHWLTEDARERLEALYGAPVHMIADATGTAFIPG